MVAAVTRAETAARNRRDLHRKRIAGQADPLRRVAWAWAWVYAELRHLTRDASTRRRPGRDVAAVFADVEDQVVTLAERLNQEGAKR